jgi:hypothetical protein
MAFAKFAGLAVAVAMVSSAGAQSDQHGRKWKPLPPTSHIVITVVKGFNGKPLQNAAVIFHAVRDGHNDGNLEVKTNEQGQASIDVIEIGSQVTVQVIADGFATSATDMNVDGPNKTLEIKLLRPRAQVSAYEENDDRTAQVKPGIQEPPHDINPGSTADNPDYIPSTAPPKTIPGSQTAPSGATPPPVTLQ